MNITPHEESKILSRLTAPTPLGRYLRAVEAEEPHADGMERLRADLAEEEEPERFEFGWEA